MKLNDIRRLTVRHRVRVRFGLSNGMECVINEHGISRIPSLNSSIDLRLEDELARAAKFSVEPTDAASGNSGSSKPRLLTRDELAAMASAAAGAAMAYHDHEE